MPFEQTITIINNSGKIISTGKQLVSIFREARSAYKEKKDALRQERNGSYRRAHTFSTPSDRANGYEGPIVEEFDDGRRYNEYEDDYYRRQRSLGYNLPPLFLEGGPWVSRDDGDDGSYASSHSRHHHRLKRSSSHAGRSRVGNVRDERRSTRPPLTTNNLRAHSEVSATRPSVAPRSYHQYRGPYAETASDGMALSRLALNEAANGRGQPSNSFVNPPPLTKAKTAGTSVSSATPASTPHTSIMVHRPRSDPALSSHSGARSGISSKYIDMNLAYGDIPPDLGSRIDLDPLTPDGGDNSTGHDESEEVQQVQAKSLVDRIEDLLNEAQCIHHTATSIISHLQSNPEAAAAIALTLAELSALLAKLSPAFLGIVKGGSPAVFALLASPQFLIGTSIAVGVTVIIFGGWKIIKRITEVKAAREEEKLAFEMNERLQAQQPQAAQQPLSPPKHRLGPALDDGRDPTLASGCFDEALVLQEELSTIESWRRGIVPPCDGVDGLDPWNGSEVDAELISPEAMRSRIGDDDERTLRSVQTRLTGRSHGDITLRNSRNHNRTRQNGHNGHKSKTSNRNETLGVPDRKSSREFVGREDHGGQVKDRRRDQQDSRQDSAVSEADSVGTSRRHHSGHSRRSESLISKAKGSRDEPIFTASLSLHSTASSVGTARDRDKKSSATGGNMLKQLFRKKKEREDKDHGGTVASAVA